MPRSEESRLESLADQSGWGDVDESDPKVNGSHDEKDGE